MENSNHFKFSRMEKSREKSMSSERSNNPIRNNSLMGQTLASQIQSPMNKMVESKISQSSRSGSRKKIFGSSL